MNTANVESTCPKCRADVQTNAHFCPQCGWDLGRAYRQTRLNVRAFLLIFVAAALLGGASWSLHIAKAGVKPTTAFRPEAAAPTSPPPDPELDRLRAAVQEQPQNVAAYRALGSALLLRLRGYETPPQALVLDATDTFSAILSFDPKDKDALVALADISFNQKVFDKAASLYERYLTENPDDLSVHARYASALTFIGKSDEAVKELEMVLEKDPANFHALAYLSITYAQIGKRDKALEMGQRALAHSPSPEAHARFSEFLNALAGRAEASAQSAAPSQPAPGGAAQLAAFIQQNPIAGPKFVSFDTPSDQMLKVFFRAFPMEAMPPFAKEKFYSSIRTKAAELNLSSLKTVEFIDADSGKVLDSLEMSSR